MEVYGKEPSIKQQQFWTRALLNVNQNIYLNTMHGTRTDVKLHKSEEREGEEGQREGGRERTLLSLLILIYPCG